MEALTRIIKNFNKKKILIVGDVMVDKYLFGEVDRISPEAPVQVVKVNKETMLPGGAANLANNVVAMGGQAELVGTLGQDEPGKQLISILEKNKIGFSGIVFDHHKPTITKTRVLSHNQQLIRLDYENTQELEEEREKAIVKSFEMLATDVDIVVFSDYDKGTLTSSLIKNLISIAKDINKTIIADTKCRHHELYKGIDLITPNHREASKMTNIAGSTDQDIIGMGQKLCSEMQCSVLITRANEGMSLFDTTGKVMHYPTEAKEVFDVSGAGDTVVAAIALSVASGASYEEASIIANQAAAIEVSKLGTATVSQKELVRRFEHEHAKIKDANDLISILESQKAQGEKVVFTSGCFDILHLGHISYLKSAAKLGNVFVVGLNTDDSIKRIKGDSRPIISEEQRAEIISLLDFVDYVTFFDEDTPEAILELLKPDVFVKGGDYNEEDLPEASVVKSYGGEISLVPFIEGYSSSKIIDKILKSYSK